MVKLSAMVEMIIAAYSGERIGKTPENDSEFLFSDLVEQMLTNGSDHSEEQDFSEGKDITSGGEERLPQTPSAEIKVSSPSLLGLPGFIFPSAEVAWKDQETSMRTRSSSPPSWLTGGVCGQGLTPSGLRQGEGISMQCNPQVAGLMPRENRSDGISRPLLDPEKKPIQYIDIPPDPPHPDAVHNSSSVLPLGEAREAPAINRTDPDMAVLPTSMDVPVAKQLLSLLEEPVKVLQLPLTVTHIENFQDGVELKVLRMRLRPDSLGDVEITLRRSGGELQVHIQVSRQSAADELRGTLEQLNDRLAGLLPRELSSQITVSIRQPETEQGMGYHQNFQRHSGENAQGGGYGGVPSGNGEGSPPHKDEQRSPMPNGNRHESENPLQPGTSGIVV